MPGLSAPHLVWWAQLLSPRIQNKSAVCLQGLAEPGKDGRQDPQPVFRWSHCFQWGEGLQLLRKFPFWKCECPRRGCQGSLCDPGSVSSAREYVPEFGQIHSLCRCCFWIRFV